MNLEEHVRRNSTKAWNCHCILPKALSQVKMDAFLLIMRETQPMTKALALQARAGNPYLMKVLHFRILLPETARHRMRTHLKAWAPVNREVTCEVICLQKQLLVLISKLGSNGLLSGSGR